MYMQVLTGNGAKSSSTNAQKRTTVSQTDRDNLNKNRTIIIYPSEGVSLVKATKESQRNVENGDLNRRTLRLFFNLRKKVISIMMIRLET